MAAHCSYAVSERNAKAYVQHVYPNVPFGLISKRNFYGYSQ